MVSFSSSTSPRASTVIFCERSPLRDRGRHLGDVPHLVGQVRRRACSRSRSGPSRCRRRPRPAPGRRACPRCRPRVATRVTSAANERSWSTIVLIVSFSSSTSPLTSTVIFCERSPFATAVVTAAMLRTCAGEVAGERVDVVGQVLPDAGDALHLGLAAELALGADLARDARDLVGEARELVDHRVDGVLQLEHLALDVDGDLLREVAVARPRSSPRRCSAPAPVRFDGHLVDESVRSFQVPETPFTRAWPPSLPSVPTSRATRVTSSAKRRELVDHRVHGRADPAELARDRLAVDLELDPLRQVAVGDRVDHARDLDRRPRRGCRSAR